MIPSERSPPWRKPWRNIWTERWHQWPHSGAVLCLTTGAISQSLNWPSHVLSSPSFAMAATGFKGCLTSLSDFTSSAILNDLWVVARCAWCLLVSCHWGGTVWDYLRTVRVDSNQWNIYHNTAKTNMQTSSPGTTQLRHHWPLPSTNKMQLDCPGFSVGLDDNRPIETHSQLPLAQLSREQDERTD